MSEGPKIKIRKFDPSKMKQHPNIVMLGKKNTGKSMLVKDLLFHHRDIPAGCVVSGSEEANSFYASIVPSILIKHEFRTEHVKNLIARQRKMIKKIESGERIDARAFLIFDDCLWDNTWIKDREVKKVLFNGRHFNITFIVTLQYPLGMPPMLRGNIDYVFILRENILANRERIYKSYASVFPTFDIFQQVLNKVTTNYGCLVIDNTVNSNNIYDCVYWYKADMHGSFKMCCESVWRLDESFKRQKERDDEDGKEDELHNFRKSPQVYVLMLMDGRA